MKLNLGSKTGGKSSISSTSPLKEKKYKEDDDENASNLDKKIGVKSIRKSLRTLCEESYPKDEMDLMIWVNIFLMLLGSR